MRTFLNFMMFLVVIAIGFSKPCRAQQFNSDNYLTMPHGTGTFVLTEGQRNASIANSFALIPNWEFFIQGWLFWENKELKLPQHFTTSVYVKYMYYENEAKTGGGAVFLGYGKAPGYYDQEKFVDRHTNMWTAVPVTLSFFDNMLSWDIMPGAMIDFNYGDDKKAVWGFTYSTRLGVYNIIPESAIVGEIFGTAGDLYSKPEYKVGIRWEPNNTVIPAFTYGAAFDGSKSSRFEIGVIIFTPPFLKIGN